MVLETWSSSFSDNNVFKSDGMDQFNKFSVLSWDFLPFTWCQVPGDQAQKLSLFLWDIMGGKLENKNVLLFINLVYLFDTMHTMLFDILIFI